MKGQNHLPTRQTGYGLLDRLEIFDLIEKLGTDKIINKSPFSASLPIPNKLRKVQPFSIRTWERETQEQISMAML